MTIDNSKLEDQGPGKGQAPTKEEWQARLDTITSIFADMVEHADQVSLTRCPYKNRFSQCTAKFRCRYQDRSDDDDIIGCLSDDKLDYRTAWETDPDAALDMHEKLTRSRIDERR